MNELKKKVITFRKTKTDFTALGYHEIAGTSIICEATKIAEDLGGYIQSFRDRSSNEFRKCKLIIRIPKTKYPKFINTFIKNLIKYIQEVRW